MRISGISGRKIYDDGLRGKLLLLCLSLIHILNRFEDGAEVTVESLLASGAISKAGDGVKILGNGNLTKKLNVKVNAVSETAKTKIEAAGGTVEVI